MTEAEWLTTADPDQMLGLLWRKAKDRNLSGRKLRLFAAACCRRIWHLLPHERSRHAVEFAERYADAQATDEELQAASEDACAVWDAEVAGRSKDEEPDEVDDCRPYTASHAAYAAAIPVGWWGGAPAFVRPDEIAREVVADAELEGAAQCILLRDIFGNPFSPVVLNPSWLTWKEGRIPKLAQDIYDERAFDRLPILADAIEEAGGANVALLAHCRGPESHVRGCWVLDLLLGKGSGLVP